MMSQIKIKRLWRPFIFAFSLTFPVLSKAVIEDVQVVDVTTKAFSVIWVSDEVVTGGSIQVFTDSAGTQELLEVGKRLVSAHVVNAHEQGLAKIEVTGLEPNSDYFIKLEGISASGSLFFPESATLLQISTSSQKLIKDGVGQALTNAVLGHSIYFPDNNTPSVGTLLIVDIPNVSSYPVSEFVGDNGFDSPLAVVNLNNLFDQFGDSLNATAGQAVRLQELRGFQVCPSLVEHKSVKYKKLLNQEDILELTSTDVLNSCNALDLNCDGAITSNDVQLVTSRLGAVQGECGYNASIDVIADGVINSADEIEVSNSIGMPVL